MEKSLHLILHTLLFTSSFGLLLGNDSNITIPFHVGVVLDEGSLVGKTGRTSISIAIEDFYAQHENYTTRLVLHSRDSGNDTVGAASAALHLLGNKKVQAIIGPQRSAQGLFVSNLGNATQVPVISFSATSPSLTSSHTPYFIRTASNDSSQVNAISSVVKAFGWREVVPIYEDTSFGTGIISYLIDALQNVDAMVPYRSTLSPTSTDEQISGELYKLMTMQTRVFIVHMAPALGSRLFSMAKEVGMMRHGYVWIMTDGLTSILESKDSLPIDSMQGVLGVRHYIKPSDRLEHFKLRWERKFWLENPEYKRTESSIYGVWAYDTIWLLAQAVEDIAGFIKPQNPKSTSESTFSIEKLGISDVGPRLLQSILKARFDPISGDFLIKNNQLQASVFQLVNINGDGGRGIGFWTPEHGISRALLSRHNNKPFSSSVSDIGVVLWPGDSTSIPTGWTIPTNDKKLKIGVPVKDGLTVFIKSKRDQLTNATIVTGYTIDVFEAVVKLLPYAISYEYITFENADGETAGSYNQLVNKVYEQVYDAVVGDVTITANRSQNVDFTLPFTESGVAMIVPVEKVTNKNVWNFFKPLTRGLWLGSFALFICTGFVLCVVEPYSNNDLGETISERLGTIFYFIFSTMVFAHRDGVQSNLSRAVVIVWVFVVLVLISSYTANLTSILTVVKLRPLVTDINQLIKNGDYVGYHNGSFVEGLLRQTFPESKIRALGEPQEFVEALAKGSKKGGVAVVFHEIPYIKVFLSQHCSGYMMSAPTHKTAGFGFVFPKGSPLVPDISKAILNVTEGEGIIDIEKRWFGNSCQKQGNDVNPQWLTFRSFWGLYLITGATTFSSVLLSIAFFIYKKRNEVMRLLIADPIWETMKTCLHMYFRGE